MGDATNAPFPAFGNTNLFTPLRVGNVQLQHRIALAPLTRMRAHEDHTPSEMAITYYGQRALGRAAEPDELERERHELVGPGDVPIKGRGQPRPLRKEEIQKYVEIYAQAAKNALLAGFDGVEIHGANGYFVHQFLQDVSSDRTDEYGGSIESRCRFPLEVVEAVSQAVGQERTGGRMSPYERLHDMHMDDPIPTFTHYVNQLKNRFPSLAYIHATEPRVRGNTEFDAPAEENNDFLREIWAPKVYIAAGGYNETNLGCGPE